jgi:hypothetical protein
MVQRVGECTYGPGGNVGEERRVRESRGEERGGKEMD